MELIDELLEDAEDRMQKSVESSRGELATVRTGRASPHLLDRITVDYYGTQTPLKQLANVATSDARLLTVTPFDKGSIGAIEKAIQESDVGLTPSNDGNVIRLQIPELTEERRREMVKVVHGVAEEGRVAVRNIRRDMMHDLRELKKEGEAGEDDERRAEAALQKQTDEAIAEIDAPPQGEGRGDPRGVTASARYVAIITDGNGRWAQQRGLPVVEGHRAGADTVKARLRDAVELGIEELTVFSFSTENWSRPAEEVDGADADVRRADRRRDPGAATTKACGCASSAAARGSPRSWSSGWHWAEETTAGNERITLFVAFNYGGRAEIVDAARSFEGDSEEEFRRHLYAPEMHDPDLLIRTSGEQRISNYLLWQCAYSELVFRDELWPDFGREAFEQSLARVRGAPAPLRRRGPRWSRTSSTTSCSRRSRRRPNARPPRAAAAALAALRGETARRILVAIPWIAFAIAITVAGGLVFALAMVGARPALPARVLPDDGGAAARPDGRLHRRAGDDRRRPLRHRLQRPPARHRLLPAALLLRRRPPTTATGSSSRWG